MADRVDSMHAHWEAGSVSFMTQLNSFETSETKAV